MRLGDLALFSAVMLVSAEASALQPLKTFTDAAKTYNQTNRAAAATEAQARASASEALGAALPSIDVRGIVAYSQLHPSFGGQPPLLPQTIWLGSAGITVPINVGAWEKRAAANAAARAAEAGKRASALDVEREVTRSYYDVVGAEAVLHAAEHARDLAQQNLGVVNAMTKEGESSQLDRERASAQTASAEQDVAEADGNVLRARRHLLTVSGVDPLPVAASDVAVDDLHEEAPLQSMNVDGLPHVAEARGTRESAEKTLTAARAKWIPTITGTASEQYTNATENLGRKDFYTLLGLATWHLDLTTAPAVSAQHAAVDAAKAKEQQAKLDAADAIYDAWVQVRADIAKARAARVQSASAAKAAELARAKYAAGEATQIDVLTALQTYIQAEVGRIRVESDLAYARNALRLSVATR